MTNGRIFLAGSAMICVILGSVPVLAKDCSQPGRAEANRKGIAGCETGRMPARPEAIDQRSLKGRNGFVDLGNGTSVRITGRVRAEAGYRR